MPKITLEYQLPEEQKTYLQATKALDMALAIDKLNEWVKDELKFASDTRHERSMKIVRDTLNRILDIHGIRLEDLL